MPLLQRLPAHVLNGLAVALGVGTVQAAVTLLAGPHAAQLALGGAVCASLADVPNTVARTRSRVPVAAVLAVLAALGVALLHPWPLALGAGIAAIAFVSAMTLAWGPRAGAVSFAPVLSLVFTMAVPAGSVSPWALAGWNAVGAAAYCAWSLGAGAVLQRRLRTLALVEAVRATADLFAARAALLRGGSGLPQVRAWIAGEAAAAERVQTARDFVFAAPDTPTTRRQAAVLLAAIDLRDLLLASRLDLDLLGDDDAGRSVLQAVAASLARIGEALGQAAVALRDGTPFAATGPAVPPLPDPFADDDPRHRLVAALDGRIATLQADVNRLRSLLDADPSAPTLSRTELQQFVAPEGWPMAALRHQLTMASPVFRHALRSALALGTAFFVALALPWTAHPHWLVLGVAVVLRGNLEQTLARRNGRVLGTLAGCVAVLALTQVQGPGVLTAVFLVAVATAHAFVLRRYWLTATAATVMALLQAHAVHPAGGFAIGERVADTVLGAALAWAFSHVLPSWERRHLPQAIGRALDELAAYAAHALALPPDDGVAPRLARRQAYDALTALAGVLQRTGAEPARVQVPVAAVARVLDHGQRLMAHLSVVRLILSRRASELDPASAGAALAEASAALQARLAARDGAGAVPALPPGGLAQMPITAPARDVMPWLVRRLQVAVHDGACAAAAAQEALRGATAPGANPRPR